MVHATRAARPRSPSSATRPYARAHRFELALEEPASRGLATIAVRPEDKAAFDAAQAWLSLRAGRRVTQWEAFTVVLAESLAREEGALAQAPLGA